MNYHIDTGLIWEKFKTDCECPLCEIKKIVEEQYLHEFLNDAVMEDDTRIKVGKEGFCARHFDMLFARPNKLSVALQIRTRMEVLAPDFDKIQSAGKAKKVSEKLKKSLTTCAVCDFVDQSMVKYYKTVAQMFANEKEFSKTLIKSKGFCIEHYAELLKYSKCAGFFTKNYLSILSSVQKDNMERIYGDLKTFCDKHDYRNANMPLGNAESALPRTREKFYGQKEDK